MAKYTSNYYIENVLHHHHHHNVLQGSLLLARSDSKAILPVRLLGRLTSSSVWLVILDILGRS
jgi:hypothetical protein